MAKKVEVPVVGLVGAGVAGVAACVATGVVSYNAGYKKAKEELFGSSSSEEKKEETKKEESKADAEPEQPKAEASKKETAQQQ